ncbi:MAG: DUF6084 family protein [Terriglobales bacterium]
MPDLRFTITGAEARPGHVTFAFTATNGDGEPVHSLSLRVQISIRAHQRRYAASEALRLGDLFGEPARWDRTLGPVAWTEAACNVGPFRGEATGQLHAPVEPGSAVTKYFAALVCGAAPLLLLFRGTVFYQDPAGLRVAPLPWDREAGFHLPVAVLHALALPSSLPSNPVAPCDAHGL